MDFVNNLVKILIFIALVAPFVEDAVAEAGSLPLYNLSISFDIEGNLIRGVSTITFPENTEADIDTGNLEIVSATLNGRPLGPEKVFRVSGKSTLKIVYKGIFREGDGKEDLENVGVVSSDVISDKGISLTGRWYPFLEGMAYYSLKAVLPEGFTAVSEAEEITVRGMEYSFHFPYPLNGINLAAGRYTVLKETVDGIDIYGYFFSEDAGLAKTYIEHAGRYLKMYENLLGPYPYRRFSIVENFLPTGYSMPTFTLLGRDVVRLPFVVETSLGHEVLHQWFGNSVYADYKSGNWTEALTTYLSDHLYKEQKETGWQYRKKILIDYQSYVTPRKETGLKDFIQRTDFASKAVGYGKGTMLFHMLKNLVGKDTFYSALKVLVKEKKFQRASWNDIKAVFQKASGESLDGFFNQWLYRKGVPYVQINDPRVLVLKGVSTVSFELIQGSTAPGEKGSTAPGESESYKFKLPVKVVAGQCEIKQTLSIEKEREFFEIPVEEDACNPPAEIVFDEDYDVMRRLENEEYPPVISRLLGDENRLLVIPEKDREKYTALIKVFEDEGVAVKQEGEIKDKDIKTSSLLVLGVESLVLKRLWGGSQTPFLYDCATVQECEGFTLMVKNNPLNTKKVIAVAYGESEDEVTPVAKKIYRYGKYSLVRFKGGRNIDKKMEQTDRGVRVNLYAPVRGIRPEKALTLDEIISDVIDKTVIYVGESHTNYEDHKVQLELVRALHESGRKFGIGMEMFQRPFQKAVDDYLSGDMTEKEFLKASEYFKRWRFNYHLYREIIDFAKTNNIPVKALNLKGEVVRKVSRGGLDALGEEERKEIPGDMDMTDEEYKKRLKEIFLKHENTKNRDFDNFYQAQILWDETMAHSVDEFLRENPGHQMVVLTGVGHIMYGSGLPKRAYRLNGKDYAILINANIETLDEGIADYVLFPKPVSPLSAPQLMVAVKKTDRGLKIEGFLPESIAKRAGLKKGDIILSIDGLKIEGIEDVRVSLFDKRRGDTFKVRVLRRKFLFGKKELEIKVAM